MLLFSKIFKVILVILFLLVSLVFSQDHFFYGRNGDKVALSLNRNKINIMFRNTDKKKVVNQKLLKYSLFDTLKTYRIQPNWFITNIENKVDENEFKSLINALRKEKDIIFVQNTYLYEESEAFTTNRFIVRLEKSIPFQTIESLCKNQNVSIINHKTEIPNLYIFDLNEKNNASVLEISQIFFEKLNALYAMPDFIIPINLYSTPSDPYFQYQYYLDQINNIDINAPAAWDITKGNSNVTVAVIDAGVKSHQDLQSYRLDVGYDVFGQTAGGPQGNEAHGMACAGIIAASHNGLGIAGIAPFVKISPIRIFDKHGDGASSTQIESAITFAWTSGHADVINNSWGYSSCNDDYIPIIRDAIDIAMTNARAGKGCLVVFAAGNSCRTCCATFPSNIPGVMTVGAIDRDGVIQYYSPHDDAIDIVAPSGGLGDGPRYYSGVCPLGSTKTYRIYGNIWSMDIGGLPGYNPGDHDICNVEEWPIVRYLWIMPSGYPTPNNNYTAHFGGTSAAAPQVAGAAALMFSVAPDMEQSLVHSFLRYMATRNGPPDSDYGWGRLNVYAAVNLANSLPKFSNEPHNKDSLDYSKNRNQNIEIFNYPNPFNSFTIIIYNLVRDEHVKLEIYNNVGQKIKTIVNEYQTAGYYKEIFDASNLPSGLYFYVLKTNNHIKTGKIILIK